jgi:threonine/homoserine/homoserine lactone efflux protein
MPPLESITTFLAASFLLGLAPGPDNIFVMTQSALYGRRSGLLVTVGLCTGLVVHTSAVAFGVAAVIRASATAFAALKIVGACYLLYLAWHAFRAPASGADGAEAAAVTGPRLYARGIVMNVTNPKVSIFFLAFLPQFVVPESGPVIPQIFLLGGLFMATTLVVFGTVALAAGTLGAWLRRSPRIQVYLNRAAALVFVLLAAKLALSSAA